jgi:hypothetical protein
MILKIGFTPRDTVLSSATLQIRSNNPFQSIDEIKLSGSGIAGSLRLSTLLLDFDKVSLDSTSQSDIIISNVGTEVLIIDTLKIIDQHPDSTIFQMIYTNIEFPLALNPDSNLSVQISFTPVEVGKKNARLSIKSRDPFRESEHIQLVGEGIAAKIDLSSTLLDFGQVAVDSISIQSFYIYNLGWDQLIIPYDGISFSGTQADAYSLINSFDVITIIYGDSAEIEIAFQPAQLGTSEAEVTMHSNDPVDSLSSIQLTGRGYDGSPISISSDQSLTTNPFVKGQPATIGFIIAGSQSIESSYVHVRAAGKNSYNKLTLSNQSGDKWSASIEAALVTERGVEYFVEVRHGPQTTYYPDNGNNLPNSIRVTVPEMPFPWQTKEKIYQMISVPLATDDRTLEDLFQEELGPYDDTKYRIFDLPDGLQYAEVTKMNKPLPPGKAMWLITKEATQLQITNAQSVPTAQDFELQLQEGWNLIATPFAFPVAWNQVSGNLALRYYDGTDWPFETVLEPFKGYAVNAPNDTVLLIPAQETQSIMKPVVSNQDQNFDGWRIQISAETDHALDRFNYVGSFKKATSAIDIFDYPEPLPIGDFISLYLVADNSSERYSTDYREPGLEKYEYEFMVSCNIEDPIDINFQEQNVPEDYDWIVVSEEKGLYYPQRTIKVTDTKIRYKMIVGTEQHIADAISDYKQLPRSYHLGQNYPNPFNPNTTIEYSLPQVSIVTINLYNILGQRIKQLMSGVRKEAGYHQIEWDGKNEVGRPVSSGIYFLNLKTDAYSHYIKMILNR